MSDLPEEWQLCVDVLEWEGVRVVYVYGPPGVGKTYAGYHFGCVESGFYALTITPETSAAQLCGHYIFKGNDVVWHDGPFTLAMREGKRLVLNEVSNANPDVQAQLMPTLESPETAQLTLHSGETVRPADGFNVVLTDNLPPDRLPEALQDRFVAIVRVSEPHPDSLAGLDPDFRELAEAALKIADDRRITARRWTNLQLLARKHGLSKGCLLAFGPERGQMVFDAIRLALARKKKTNPELSLEV
jgi:MoxR-like ATPase